MRDKTKEHMMTKKERDAAELKRSIYVEREQNRKRHTEFCKKWNISLEKKWL